jgi:hypothetical protein
MGQRHKPRPDDLRELQKLRTQLQSGFKGGVQIHLEPQSIAVLDQADMPTKNGKPRHIRYQQDPIQGRCNQQRSQRRLGLKPAGKQDMTPANRSAGVHGFNPHQPIADLLLLQGAQRFWIKIAALHAKPHRFRRRPKPVGRPCREFGEVVNERHLDCRRLEIVGRATVGRRTAEHDQQHQARRNNVATRPKQRAGDQSGHAWRTKHVNQNFRLTDPKIDRSTFDA